MDIKTHGYSVTRNTTGGRDKPKFIVMHYTATNGATAYNEVMYFAANPEADDASADFFVDETQIWQYNTQLDSRYSWAVGDGQSGTFGGKCTNRNQISVEMCCYLSDSDGKWYIGQRTYNNAVELVKYLMKKYGIPAQNVIRHYDVSRKLCPQAVGWIPATGEDTWKKFKAAIGAQTAQTVSNGSAKVNTPIYRVRRSANDAKSQIGAFNIFANAKKFADSHKGYSVFDGTGKLVYSPGSRQKTNAELAREVINGKWGNGADRIRRLTDAGYDYAAVQAEVNRIMGG